MNELPALPDTAIVDFIARSGLVPPGVVPTFAALEGGVSSDVWLVRAGDAAFCIKRALPRLRVAAEWNAPVERNATEVSWMKAVAELIPSAVPTILADDRDVGVFAMTYLSPDRNHEWKNQLYHGKVELPTAIAVGERLGRVHSAFARSGTARQAFATDSVFNSLRLEPYLLETARVHPKVAAILTELAETTLRTKITVVHGDVSPKNIWVSSDGPVFLDGECAWFGDPAFDLAFCLNHLLLKTLWVPSFRSLLLDAFTALAGSYLRQVDWESPEALERRAARLLPGLLLARVDGKSPVEYLTDEDSKDVVRRVAYAMLIEPPTRLLHIKQMAGEQLRSSRSGSRSSPSNRIARIVGRRVWDSRGRPTVEAEVVLENGKTGRAIAPAGASTGTNEAVDLRDGGTQFQGFGVERATASINCDIAKALRGAVVTNQALIDDRLIELDGTPNKARLGGNAIVAVSMAVLHAAAASEGEPLWRYLADGAEPSLPMPMIQIFGGGAHAGRRIDIQDFLIMPINASSFDEAMLMSARVYEAAGHIMSDRGLLRGVADEGGWWPEFLSNADGLDTLVEAIERSGLRPGQDVGIALDIAASQLRQGREYRLKLDDMSFDADGFIERLQDWCRRYPIVSIEDPLAEDDVAGMSKFTALMGDTLQVVGDDFLVTSADRIASASKSGACNAVLLKPNQTGTVTETAAALSAARKAGWSAIVSARSGESEDVTIVHLAVGWGVGQLKVGSLSRSERMAKWNEALRIEEALGSSARFRSGHPRTGVRS